MTLLVHQLPYHHNSAILFAHIAHEPWAMMLDSGQLHDEKTGKPGSQYGHYDIIVARPFITLVTQDGVTSITQNTQVKQHKGDPFAHLNGILKSFQMIKNKSDQNTWPFAGGALGYFSYDLSRTIEKLPHIAAKSAHTPEMMLGIYDWAIIVDHRTQKTHLLSYGLQTQTTKNWPALCHEFEQSYSLKKTDFKVTSPLKSNLDKSAYQAAFQRIQQWIQAGDCYQVNLAQRFSATVEGDSWAAYQYLRKISPAPFMAYMNLPFNHKTQFQVLSVSPERFLQLHDQHVETRPIKGTRPRAKEPAQDTANSNELLTSSKDKAENVMIVDLLRNDIGKSCKTGSVKATQLFKLQSFANVHHLVSIVVGQLKQGLTAVDLLKGCFPGGSITGAPKLRSMQIIESLEPHRRDVYCGCMGYIGFDGNMDTNIAIRTATVANGFITFYAGGGIVADSNVDKEYEETLDKASNLIAMIKYFMRL